MIDLTLKELKELAKQKNIKGYSNKRKDELIELLIQEDKKEKEFNNTQNIQEKTNKEHKEDRINNLLNQIDDKNTENKTDENNKENESKTMELLSNTTNLTDLISNMKKRDTSKDLKEPVNIFNSKYETIDLGNGQSFEINRETDSIKEGYLNILPSGYGFLRNESMRPSNEDIYISANFISQFNAREGDRIKCIVRDNDEKNKYPGVIFVIAINGINVADGSSSDISLFDEKTDLEYELKFEKLTPIFPEERIVMETTQNELIGRIIDLVTPIGKGQRALIVAPPKTGKTTIMKNIAKAILNKEENKELELIVLLIDERPEEVTAMKDLVGENKVYASTFDKRPEEHVKVSEKVLKQAKNKVVKGKDVVILMDSITRLARAYNLYIPSTGKILSGGFDSGALHMPKKFFGAARNIKEGGSLTIIATALIETGSKMDDLIYEEFKGTGNMELILDRDSAEKRIFPAVDIKKSATREEHKLLSEDENNVMEYIRKNLPTKDVSEGLEQFIYLIKNTPTNIDFVKGIIQIIKNSKNNNQNIFK